MGSNILMILDEEFPPDDRVYKETQTLIENGFSVSIACYTFSNEKPKHEIIDDIEIFRKRVPKIIYKSSVAALKIPLYFNWWKKYIKSVLLNNSFDIIHVHDLPLAKVGVYFKHKYNLKLVVDLHENWPAYLERAIHVQNLLGKILSPNKLWRKYEKTILKNADKIITVVDEMSERLAKLGLEKQKMVEIQNVITPERFPDMGCQPDNDYFTLFYAGDIARVRGFQTILDDLVLAKNKIKGLRVWVIGKGNYLKGLQELVNEKGLSDIFTFYGWQPLPEVMKLLEKANVGLMPHLRWEQNDCSSPNKLYQYMLKQKPSLCSPADSVIRILNETQSGVVYNYNKPGDFCEKLVELFNNPDSRVQMGKNGYEWVFKKYNWKNYSNNLVEAYNSIV